MPSEDQLREARLLERKRAEMPPDLREKLTQPMRGQPLNIPIPIIRLEIDHLRHVMAMAMTNYTVQLDQMLQESIENFCTEDNLRRIIDEEARRTIDKTLRDAVRSWFLMEEDGQEVIKKYVAAKLREDAKLFE